MVLIRASTSLNPDALVTGAATGIAVAPSSLPVAAPFKMQRHAPTGAASLFHKDCTVAPLSTGLTKNNVPFARYGADPSLVVLAGGQGFVRRSSPERLARDARRIARLLPQDCSFVLLGYDAQPVMPLSIDHVVASAASAIEEVSAGRSVDLLGVSFGGMIACRVAASRPRLARRLLLVASAHAFSPEGVAHARRQIALLEAGDLVGFAGAFTGLFRRRWLNWLTGLVIRLSSRRIVTGFAPACVIVAYLAAMLSATELDLSAVRAPALVIGGGSDQFFGDGMMDKAAAELPLAELTIIAGETHMAPVEVADKLRIRISAFLSTPPTSVGNGT